jgi:hypothetical protein
MKKTNEFHQELKKLMDKFLNKTYDYTKKFPREETFGLTS